MPYNPHLDGLRAIAAIVVVAFHANAPLLSGGFLGVDIFFVLSGYLITKILIEEKYESTGINYRRFLIRRLWRLYPALLLLIAAYAILGPTFFPQYNKAKHYQDIALAGLYLSDYARAFDTPLSVLNHTWSLSVEMHFYLLWPLILSLLLRLPRARLPFALLLMWVVATVWRWCGFTWFEDGWDIYNRADTHCSGLILGALLATFKPSQSKALGFAGVVLVAFAITFYQWKMVSTALFGFSVAEIGAAMIILSPPAWMGNSILVWIGRLSYGLYLWHYPIVRAMRSHDFSWPALFLDDGVRSCLLPLRSLCRSEQALQFTSASPQEQSPPQ